MAQSKIKGWKKHNIMKLNLIVVAGEITFVLHDDRLDSPTYGEFFEARLSSIKPERLSVPLKFGWLLRVNQKT